MSFAARENSRSLGEPDTLFRFTSGGAVYGYTDAEQPISFGGVTYQPIPVDRDSVTSSGTLDKTTLKIVMPTDTPVVELFRVYPPSEVVGVTIFQGHSFDLDFKAAWSGKALSCSRAYHKATIACEPISTSMKRPGLRRRYQRGCPHVLYGDRCRILRENFSRNTVVATVDGPYVTLPSGFNGPFSENQFANGMFSCRGERRQILKVSHLENALIISGAIPGMVHNDPVTITLGCAHTMNDCRDVFNNIQNYGGQPWIPTKNPIGNDQQFY